MDGAKLQQAMDLAVAKGLDENAEVITSSPLDSDEVAIAADQYSKLITEIKGRASTMKAGALKRALVAFAEYPFGAKIPKLSTAEQTLFLLLISNSKAKGVIHTALRGYETTLQEEAVSNVTNKILDDASKAIKGEDSGKNVD